MKKILLIGKNGQLGQSLLENALLFDFEIIGVDKDDVNVTNENQIKDKIKEIKPDILINTSAYHVVSKCEENASLAMAVNFVAVKNLAKICRENDIIFITYSTDYVFDGTKNSSYEETDDPNPLQMYGLSKLAGEYASREVYPEGTFVIRTCGLYGGKTGSPEKGGNFVLNILKEAQNKDSLEVSSEQVVSPTYAGDLSRATLTLLKLNPEAGIYHLVNSGYCSWYEFTKEIFELANIKKEVKPVDRGGSSGDMKRPKFSALDNKKAELVGIKIPSWQKGLESYFNFLKENESKN